jgi:hypothetical protein
LETLYNNYIIRKRTSPVKKEKKGKSGIISLGD